MCDDIFQWSTGFFSASQRAERLQTSFCLFWFDHFTLWLKYENFHCYSLNNISGVSVPHYFGDKFLNAENFFLILYCKMHFPKRRFCNVLPLSIQSSTVNLLQTVLLQETKAIFGQFYLHTTVKLYVTSFQYLYEFII